MHGMHNTTFSIALDASLMKAAYEIFRRKQRRKKHQTLHYDAEYLLSSQQDDVAVGQQHTVKDAPWAWHLLNLHMGTSTSRQQAHNLPPQHWNTVVMRE
jgi:hypothetical protein